MHSTKLSEFLTVKYEFVLLGTDIVGRVDMKRICGITAVEERVRPGRDVKVLSQICINHLFIHRINY